MATTTAHRLQDAERQGRRRGTASALLHQRTTAGRCAGCFHPAIAGECSIRHRRPG